MLILLYSLLSFGCMNTIPLSEAVKAVNLEPNAGSKSCKDLPNEPCLCFDGIDWEEVELKNGKFVKSNAKKAAKLARQEAQELERQEKLAERQAVKALKDKETLSNQDVKRALKYILDKVD
jgi:hypothetical protein